MIYFSLVIDHNLLTGTVPLELDFLPRLETFDVCKYQFIKSCKFLFYNTLIFFFTMNNTAENEITGSIRHMCHVPNLFYDTDELSGGGFFCKVEKK